MPAKPNTHASTGPRSGERGRQALFSRRPKHCKLQRGRAQVSAEGRGYGVGAEHEDAASTGPRSGERGRSSLREKLRRITTASTGPRSGERGRHRRVVQRLRDLDASTGPRSGERGRDSAYGDQSIPTDELQRGRAQVSAEGFAPCPEFNERHLLQRGRAQVSAEGWRVFGLAHRSTHGFNGAALR